MKVTYDPLTPTPHQLLLADRLEEVLRTRVRYQRLFEPNRGNGPSIDFRIHTRRAGLSVALVLYQDSFHISAGGASARIELISTDEYEKWADNVVNVTFHLLRNPIRIRVRKPVLRWLPTESAMYLSNGVTSGWNGNILAFRGAAETVFEDWCESVESG